ncbi:MAG: hypothetical protein K940chlam6_00151 [Chlamydiae bacterium]|nr:hypothetical protein [Chlamydiota bacterium]
MQETELEPYKQFVLDLDGKKKIEEKIRLCLDFMRNALSQEKTPAFRDFWQAKRTCLDFFKEKMPPRIRTIFWAEYVELSDEIRRLNEVLNEESSFAGEQMDLAIQAIEKDLERKELILKESDPIEVPKVLQINAKMYEVMQSELGLFNTFTGRLNALRKELIQINLRIKQKNRLFETLSKLGDQAFPRRKELVKEISILFSADITLFVEKEIVPPFFERKEEIKALQSFAKVLNLSTRAFTETRQKLSEYWDQIKEKEKEQHKERAEKRGIYKENFEIIDAKIASLKEDPQAEERIDALFKEIKELELGREEVKILKKRLMDVKKPIEEKQQREREEQKKAAGLEQKRQLEAQQQLLDHSLEVLNQAEVFSLDALVEKWEALVKGEKALFAKGIEKTMLESRIDTIADHIQEKKWQNLLEENPEDLSSSLHVLLDERHKAKRKVKESLEAHRRTVGGSALSLEESMLYQELIGEEKLRLDTVETMIEEIEEKLFDLEE